MSALSSIRLVALCAAAAVAAACVDGPDETIASARTRLAKGEAAAAVIELKDVLQGQPDSREARVLLGKALLATNEPAQAEVELRRALELGAPDDQVLPPLAKTQLLLGRPSNVTAAWGSTALHDAAAQAELKTWVAAAWSQQGDVASANEAIGAALRAQPLYPAAVIVQARMKAVDGDVDGALRALDAVLAHDPGNADAVVAKGYLLWLGKHDAAAALAAHRKVLAAHPGYPAAQAEVVTILFREGKVAEARQEFDKLKAAAPQHPETVFFDAQFAYLDAQYARSRELTDALLKIAPDHLRALELAAAAEYKLGNDAQAQAFAARALKAAPDMVLARQLLARCLLRSAEPNKALAVLAPLRDAKQPDATAIVLTGDAYMQLGDIAQADAAFKRAAELGQRDTRARTDAALGLVETGQADLALDQLQQLAAGDPGPRTAFALVSARIATGDFKGALDAIDALAAKLPGQPLPDQLRGQVLVSLHDAAGARRSFEAALAKNDKYFPAVAALAAMDVATGKPERARERVLAFLDTSPQHGQASLLLVSIPTPDGIPSEDALARLAAAARANPAERDVQQAMIAQHLRRGEPAAALNVAQNAAAALPRDIGTQQMLAQTQLVAGQTQQAIATWSKVVSARPDDAPAQVGLAQALLAGNDKTGAKRALQRALELDADADEARQALAMLALNDNRPQDAIALAREMQKRHPKGALGWAVEGDIDAQRKDWASAVPAYRKALDLSHASEAAIKLHNAYRALGRTADADRLSAEWEKARPNDPAYRFYLGGLAANSGDYARAESHYRAVLASQPNNAVALNNVAWMMHRQSKPGALAMAEKADTLMPNRAPILDTLAAIQAASGKVDDAIATQRKAIAAAPKDPNLQLNLARLQIQAAMTDEARATLESLARLGNGFAKQTEVSAMLKTL